jgi:glycosyltransferase involved in cell wall biosynthesis
MDISVVVPAFNEAESLEELTTWVDRVCSNNGFQYEIIFIDDGSTDASWEKIKALSGQFATVRAIRFRRNHGKSAALNVGFSHAEGDVVITMDADLQDNPDEIPELYHMIKENHYHLVSGWKRRRKDPMNKTIPSWFFNRFTRMMTGIKLHDINCGLKAYQKEVVKNIEVYGEMHRYIPVIAKYNGFGNIGEKTVKHLPRKYGHTKFGMERYIKGFLDVFSIMFVSKFGKRPMHMFGSLGTLLFIIGFIIAGYLSYAKFFLHEYNMTERPLFYLGLLSMVIGSQFFVTGFMAELVSRSSADRNHYNISETIRFDKEIVKQNMD